MFKVAEEYEQFYLDAEGFYKNALSAYNRRKLFTNEIIYNVASMAIEKYVMAYLGTLKSLPYNHTLTDLAESMESHVAMGDDFYRRMKNLDRYQMICSFDTYQKKEITHDVVSEVVFVMTQLREQLFLKKGG